MFIKNSRVINKKVAVSSEVRRREYSGRNRASSALAPGRKPGVSAGLEGRHDPSAAPGGRFQGRYASAPAAGLGALEGRV